MKENAHSHWTATITNYLIKQMRDFYGKVPLRRSSTIHNTKTLTNHEKRKLKLTYIIKLLYWTYREGLVDKDLLLTLLIDELHKSSKIEHQLLLLFVLIQYLEEIFIRPFVWTKFLEFCQSKLLLVRISSVTFLCVIHLSFIPFAAIIVFTSSFSYSSIRIYWQIP